MISYAHERKALGVAIHAALVAAGHAPRIDHNDLRAGDPWRTKLARWMADCDTGIVLMSPEAQASPWVRHELSVLANRRALDGAEMQVIVVLLDVTRTALGEDPALSPLDFGSLQMNLQFPELADDRVNATADTIAAAVWGPPAGFDSPFTRLVKEVQQAIGAVGGKTALDASDHLVKGRAVDPWDRPRVSEVGTPDGDAAARHALAADLCAAPCDGNLFAPLDLLSDARHELDVAALVDHNLAAALDGAVIDWLREPLPAVSVLPVTRCEMVTDVAAKPGMKMRPAPRQPHVFVVNLDPSHYEPGAYAQGVDNELRDTESNRGRLFDALPGPERAGPPVAVLARAGALTAAHVADCTSSPRAGTPARCRGPQR